MKAFVCEMCNSQDLVKQDGYFVCQSCGTKYSIEEAKKLMVEIEGAVRIDNSDYVERYLQNARRAKSKGDWAEVEKYYNMVEQNQPNNIEAIFYSAYGKAKQSLVESDQFKRTAVFKVLFNSISVLDDNYDISREAELKPLLVQIANDILAMCCSSFSYTSTQYGDNKDQTYSIFAALVKETITTMCNIVDKFPLQQRASVLYIYDLCLKIGGELLRIEKRKISFGGMDLAHVCNTIVKKIRECNPAFTGEDYTEIVNARLKAEKAEDSKGIWLGIAISIVVVVVPVVISLIIAN